MKQYYNAKDFYYRGTDYYFKSESPPPHQVQSNIENIENIENFQNDSETCHQCASEELKISKHDPKYWGPRYWFFYHTTAINFPEKPSIKEQADMIYFIKSIPLTLPCHNCKKHAQKFIEEHNNKLQDICSSRLKLFNFFVDFHNQVNKRTGKKILTHEEAFNIYK